MLIWRSLEEIPGDLGHSVVVIGNFDGVHLGHQHVVSQGREIADAQGLDLIAVTFDPHPIAVLRPEHAPQQLTQIDERCRLLAAAGVDNVLVLPFSREIAAWTPDEFIDRVLINGLHCAAVVVGANFRFGSKAAGDVSTLRAHGGFSVEGIVLDGGPQVWSSTYVRTCLAAGDVEGASEALGRPYSVVGPVTRGDQRGRELGYPTANVALNGQAAPADGVYAGWLTRRDTERRFPAAISVGTNPTFAGERERRVEAYVLDQTDLNLYDVEVEVAFIAHLRGMLRFNGVDELLTAMADDVNRTRAILSPTD